VGFKLFETHWLGLKAAVFPAEGRREEQKGIEEGVRQFKLHEEV